jgi:uncharacterized protein with von Willebrand factor type A (vWA) domain
MAVPDLHPHGMLAANVAAFCRELRGEHGFTIGPGEAADALLAVEHVGVADVGRVRAALRLVLCASSEQSAAFDALFDAFFLPEAARGVLQRNLNPRHTRPSLPPPPQGSKPAEQMPDRPSGGGDETDDELDGRARRRIPVAEEPDERTAWQVMHARYSAAASESAPPEVPREGLDAMLVAAGMLVQRLQLGRSRRWRPMLAGPRYDFRRTMRSSLQTGGEAMKPRWQGHPRRNPRIVVVVDGSRSMSESAARMLQFAYALSRRTARLRVFIFSTELRDVTRQLRRTKWGDLPRLIDVAEAWGGGTRIGECLDRLIREFGHQCLSEHTAIFILSDGLDVGEPDRLRHAMRELRRRGGGVVWLNPLLGTPGYVPSSQGMSAALPYVDVFTAAGDAEAFQAMARTLTL